MDLLMPVMDGYDAIERIMAWRPTPIVVLSSRAHRNQMQLPQRTGMLPASEAPVMLMPPPIAWMVASYAG